MTAFALIRPIRHALAGLVGLWLGGVQLVAAGPSSGNPPPVLTGIKEVQALSTERANEMLPVVVRGVVTRVTPYELFLQDGPDAIFVWREFGNDQLKLGDFVEATGVTNAGQLFPIVRSATIRILGHQPLPTPQVMPYAELASGRGDCQWVEVAGMVETVETKTDGSRTLRVLYDGMPLRVELVRFEGEYADRLLGARVRLRGVVNGLKTAQRRLIEPVLCTEGSPGTLWIEQPGPVDIFSLPRVSAAALGGPEAGFSLRQMVRVDGVVTCQPDPRVVFVRDGERSLEIRLAQPAAVRVGDRIEAAGFAEMGIIQPLLKSALLRRVGPGPAPTPRRISAGDQLLDPLNEAELIEVEGELRDISHRSDGWVMLLSLGGQALNVEIGAKQFAAAELPPVGSRLALVGICLIERVTPPGFDQVVAPASARLHLRAADDLRVLSRPSWWTLQRLLAAVAVLSFFALGAIGWIWTLNRRVQAQTRIILGNAERQAVLEERNRIAREFHDTIEQQIAGATILLDAVDTVVVDQPQRARDGLQTARSMLRHSLDEAQQAVANLRNNDLFESDFGPLVESAVRERLAASGLRAEFRHEGDWPSLDSMVKQHLLRIVQESVTNVVKHARASLVTVTMHAGPKHIGLQVADDGCGFNPQDRPGRSSGEFGLIGLQERAQKIGACLTINSAPQAGTTVTVTLNPAVSATVL